jgi:transposase
VDTQSHYQQQQQQQQLKDKDFTLVSSDESFFFYDSLIKRVWIDKEKRPVVRITGSHKHSCLFGAISLEGKQLFRQYNRFNGDTFFGFLKLIHIRFPKCYLFIDKASPHFKSKKIMAYFEQNKDTLIPVYLPTASPEFKVMEEIWNIAKRDLLVLKYYSSFADFKVKMSGYFRTKRFNLDMKNYLLRDV